MFGVDVCSCVGGHPQCTLLPSYPSFEGNLEPRSALFTMQPHASSRLGRAAEFQEEEQGTRCQEEEALQANGKR